MNKKWIAFHLDEAATQLRAIVDSLSSESDYSYGEFVVEISHAYHHINTAWNSRDATPEAVADHSDADYDEWQKMPSEDELMMGTLSDGE